VHPWINLAGVVVTMVLVVVVGVLATWDVLMRKPLSILRES
jgi:predicted lysophospholipase L1 biosynthesis ABC-type transport system permease subunit